MSEGDAERLSACIGKIKYRSKAAAERAMKHVRYRKQVVAYKCSHCHAWHGGSNKHKNAKPATGPEVRIKKPPEDGF